MERLQNFINGEFSSSRSSNTLDNFNPATGKVYGQLPASNEVDVDDAVGAAQAVFSKWSTTPTSERSRVLMKIAELIEVRLQEFAEAESMDTGKPLGLARKVDIPRAVANFRFYAGAAEHFFSEAHIMEQRAINYTLRQPLGVVGCISPWNLPLYLLTWKIAPAIAAGNCVVAKPSELTPKTAALLAELLATAGVPAGVINIVHGEGESAGAAIVKHPGVKAVSFTGGTETGARISEVAAPQFKKLSLELGGKNPNIIFADCDFDKMLETTLRSSFINQGQVCLCGSRIFVEQPIYERFRDALVERTRELKVGDPMDAQTHQGAVISQQHMEKILTCINQAKEEGASLLTGGERVILKGRCEKGWFVQPTILEGLAADAKTNQREIFGPVVSLMPFKDEQQVVRCANESAYGLAATVWTQNLSRAHRMAAELEAGILWINCWMLRDLRTPFGGMKHSGLGREGGFEALRFFTEAKNVCIDLTT